MSARERIDWDERYRQSEPIDSVRTSPFLELVVEVRPPPGTLLELAGGLGEDAIWFASRGYDVTLTDISRVGLNLARRAAAERGVALRYVDRDLDLGPPEGRWDVIHCHHYLNRDLFQAYPQSLTRDGLLAVSHPTVSNLERHPRPSRRHLLELGEMYRLARFAGLDIIHDEEGWGPNGKHEARVLARLSMGSGQKLRTPRVDSATGEVVRSLRS